VRSGKGPDPIRWKAPEPMGKGEMGFLGWYSRIRCDEEKSAWKGVVLMWPEFRMERLWKGMDLSRCVG
jgi:hypothetical protein